MRVRPWYRLLSLPVAVLSLFFSLLLSGSEHRALIMELIHRNQNNLSPTAPCPLCLPSCISMDGLGQVVSSVLRDCTSRVMLILCMGQALLEAREILFEFCHWPLPRKNE